jgi:beta-glucosidase/6-phospho-beta-glucosidase/beta-galactosidase
MNNENPFRSFWMAGFECTDQLNAFGNRVDMLTTTGHLQLIKEDYKNLSPFQIKTVREGIQWSRVEKMPYHYDWSTVHNMIMVAKENDVQQIWDICHFGFPDDLTPLHPQFAKRFAALCKAFVEFYRTVDADSVLIITPINEVSFISWLGGDVRGTAPYCKGQGWEVKYHLMKAYIEGIEAIKAVDNNVRILTTEPLVNIVAPLYATSEQIEEANKMNEEQFQVTEILCGNICKELRGKPEYLDILGYNYYYNNQWQMHSCEILDWKENDPCSQYVSLDRLLQQVYNRYQRPLVITETSHPKEDRPLWVEMITEVCLKTLENDLPLWGVCWYPVLNRPDWDFLDQWHFSGIWDDVFSENNKYRMIHHPTAESLIDGQKKISAFVSYRMLEKELIEC